MYCASYISMHSEQLLLGYSIWSNQTKRKQTYQRNNDWHV